ncbi:MAG: O-acetyl-ADP-ribose deacetylase [Treponema sp.]|jgi:O-acetyl-ADP-ribose deacetylase (regulator of RNase III)|nr:O-acetyl-ADP-ribose deacetylase [Treponema sp.]
MAVIEVILGDITKIDTDAIVNAANSSLMGGGGVDGAIHSAAGARLLEECIQIAKDRYPEIPCPTGDAVITGAGKLPARHVIHTVGPVWYGGGKGEPLLLASCYRKSLLLAEENSLGSVAFPNISTGIFGYPKEKAASVAIDTVRETLPQTPGIKRVIFVCFDEENYSLYCAGLPV